MAVDKIVEENFIRFLVECEHKTHKEVSLIISNQFPGTRGISERSIRRYCCQHDIHRSDSSLSSNEVNSVVLGAIEQVNNYY